MVEKHILLVDDDAEIRFGTSLRLKSFGYSVKTATDGEEAIEQAMTDPPSLMLMDIRMPRLDGLSALRRLQADPVTRSIPVVIASASPNDQENSLELGAKFFLRKPYSNESLAAAITSAVTPTHCLPADCRPAQSV